MRFASKHAADGYFFPDLADFLRQFLIHGLIQRGNLFPCFRIDNILGKHATDNALRKRLDNSVAFLDSFYFDAAHIIVTDTDFLCVACKRLFHIVFRNFRVGSNQNISVTSRHILYRLFARYLMDNGRKDGFTRFRIRRAENYRLRYHGIADNRLGKCQ